MPRVEEEHQELLRDLYLDLLKNALAGREYSSEVLVPPQPRRLPGRAARKALSKLGLRLAKVRHDHAAQGDWPFIPPNAFTMSGLKRLDNLQACVERTLRDGIPGHFIEAGVWRGGCCILMKAILAVNGVSNREVWVADSFAGFPPENAAQHPLDKQILSQPGGWNLAVSVEEIRSNFARFHLLDDRVRFLEGWFEQTLSSLDNVSWAVIRLDGDLYSSTMASLTSLYPRLNPGGFLIIDDYGAFEACRTAVEEYREAHQIRDPIQRIDWTGVYWRRELS